MQGVFNVNWDSVVNPNLDEKTALERNKRQINDEESNNVFSVHPPDLEFTIYHHNKELKIFVMNGNFELREGQFGHYIKPYAIHEKNGKKYTKPYPNPKKITDNFFIFPGTPGYPYPPESVLDQFTPRQTKVQILHTLTNLRQWNTINFQRYFNIDGNVDFYFQQNDKDYLFVVDKKNIFTEYNLSLSQNDDEDEDPNYLPDTRFSQERVDFIRAYPDHNSFYEIGKDYLCSNLKRAEELDYEFSKKIQGLLGSTSDFVWSCLDPDFDPMDRNKLLNIYLENYIKDNAKTSKIDPDFRAVATDEVQQHKAFCEEWVKKNYKSLTPVVTSTAELLVSEFYQFIKGRMNKDYTLTISQLCRVLMRHEKFSSQFSICLQSYMQNIENTRSGRNPSYKQITTVQISKALAFKTFVNFMEANRNELKIVYDKTSKNLSSYYFNTYTVDWHYIVGKLPDIHHHYKKLRLTQEINDEDLPPWLVGKKSKT